MHAAIYNHYTAKMTELLDLVAWIIHSSFLLFLVNLFTKIQLHIAIHSNTICYTALAQIISPLLSIQRIINYKLPVLL